MNSARILLIYMIEKNSFKIKKALKVEIQLLMPFLNWKLYQK